MCHLPNPLNSPKDTIESSTTKIFAHENTIPKPQDLLDLKVVKRASTLKTKRSIKEAEKEEGSENSFNFSASKAQQLKDGSFSPLKIVQYQTFKEKPQQYDPPEIRTHQNYQPAF